MHPRKADVVTPPERRRHYLAAGHWDSSTLAGRVADHARARPGDLAVVDEARDETHAPTYLGRELA